jgi:hypothetical protein
MPTETRGKPLPTPHPDQPGPIRAQSPAPKPKPQPPEPDDSGEYDSFADDVYMRLSQPLSEPDPALQSSSSTGDESSSPGENAPIASAPPGRKKQPRTSELFKALASGAGSVKPSKPGSEAASSRERKSRPAPGEGALPPDPTGEGSSEEFVATRRDGQESTSDYDNQIAESRMTWVLLLLLSYASAVTLALFWVLWTGRTLRPALPPTTNTRQLNEESNAKSWDPAPSRPLPPIPRENHASPGETVRIGQLEITPLAIESAPVVLVRLVEPVRYRREDADSLMLRLKLTNISSDQAFAPLDRALIRGQNSALDGSQIACSDGETVALFPLAVDSEWVIEGQEFPVLKPGETVETLVASEAVTDDRLGAEMTWRVRLRFGPNRTDVLAVPFTKDDISVKPHPTRPRRPQGKPARSR